MIRRGSSLTFQRAQLLVVRALAGEIRVVWDGSWPHIDFLEGAIHLPPPPSEMTADEVTLWRAFADHEAAHAIYTDIDDFVRHAGLSRSLMSAIEDGRINRRLGSHYGGCGENIREAHLILARRTGEGPDGEPTLHHSVARATMALVHLAYGLKEEEALVLVRGTEDPACREMLACVRRVTSRFDRLGSSADVRTAALSIRRIWARRYPALRRPARHESTSAPQRGEIAPADSGEIATPETGFEAQVASALRATCDAAHPRDPLTEPPKPGVGPEEDSRTREGLLDSPRRTVWVEDSSGRLDEPSTTQYMARTDQDVVQTVSPERHEKTESLQRAALGHVGFLMPRLLADMAVPRQRWVRHETSGTLDARSLYRIGVADPRVFRVRARAPHPDQAVSLLVDFSGSMAKDPIALATQLAILFSATCDRIPVANEVLGFTTLGWERDPPAGHADRWTRYVPLRHLVIKPFDRSFEESRHAFARACHDLKLRHNIDGEAVRWAGKRLATRAERRKTLLVLSDGRPEGASGRPGCDELLQQDLRAALAETEAAGVRCIGIGIMSADVEEFYPHAVVIEELEALVRGGYEALSRILRQEVRPRRR